MNGFQFIYLFGTHILITLFVKILRDAPGTPMALREENAIGRRGTTGFIDRRVERYQFGSLTRMGFQMSVNQWCSRISNKTKEGPPNPEYARIFHAAQFKIIFQTLKKGGKWRAPSN